MIVNSLLLLLVNIKQKIPAVFFLSIYGMFMLHQVLPHVHHEHHEFEPAITKIDHHHGHEMDHHHHDAEADDGFDFLGFLLGNHSHNIDVNTVPTAIHFVSQKVVGKWFSFEITLVLLTRFLFQNDEKIYSLGHAPPDLGEDTYLSVTYLRGPPVLG